MPLRAMACIVDNRKSMQRIEKGVQVPYSAPWNGGTAPACAVLMVPSGHSATAMAMERVAAPLHTRGRTMWRAITREPRRARTGGRAVLRTKEEGQASWHRWPVPKTAKTPAIAKKNCFCSLVWPPAARTR